MSILIKGMKIPSSCFDCDMIELSGAVGCSHAYDTKNSDLQRAEDCPLVPVPPHFDLIDHNALKIAVMDCDAETRIDFLKHAMDCINKAPVVIPSDMPLFKAEEGET